MNPDFQQQIEDYLLDRLDPEAHKEFIKRMENDKTLAREVKIQEAMLQQFTDLGHLQMRKKLEKIKQKTGAAASSANAINPRRKILPLILSVAAIALLLIIGYQVFQPSPTPQQLFAQHYKTYPLPFGDRSDNVNLDLITAGNLYQKGDYEEAIPLLQSILNNNENSDDRVQLALGISQIETGQYQEALQTFDQIKKEPHNFYTEQAEWYAALTYLQLKKINEAKSLLVAISKNQKHFFYKSALSLLSDLN